MTSIGLLNEQPLHASLKHWYARSGDVLEAPLDGFIVDILRGNHVIEVQTGSFTSIRRKVRTLSRHYRVTLVYPVAHERWIVQLPSTAQDQPVRRKSPRRQRLDQLFQELVSFPDLLQCPNFTIEVVLIREEQVRRYDRRRGWRRRGWVVMERRLLEVLAQHVFTAPADLWTLIPVELPEPFHTAHLARVLDRPRRFAQKVAYCLRESGASTAIGKASNAIVYSRTPSYEAPDREIAGSHDRVPGQLHTALGGQPPPRPAAVVSGDP